MPYFPILREDNFMIKLGKLVKLTRLIFNNFFHILAILVSFSNCLIQIFLMTYFNKHSKMCLILE